MKKRSVGVVIARNIQTKKSSFKLRQLDHLYFMAIIVG